MQTEGNVTIMYTYNDMNFNREQFNEIRKGIDSGLTDTQIETYAKPMFRWTQMKEIRLGFEGGLSMEQISQYARPELNNCRMREMRLRKIKYNRKLQDMKDFATRDL